MNRIKRLGLKDKYPEAMASNLVSDKLYRPAAKQQAPSAITRPMPAAASGDTLEEQAQNAKPVKRPAVRPLITR